MGYYCSVCKLPIEKKVYEYSMKNFNKILCRSHQPAQIIKGTLTPNKKKKATKQAQDLGQALANRGWDVWLEKWDGHKHIDISIIKARVNIEVDGPQHNTKPKQALADLKRTYHSFKKGWLTLRIPNCLVNNSNSLEETANYINDFLNDAVPPDEEEYDEE